MNPACPFTHDAQAVWYRQKFGQSPSYSQILDELARTPYDRREVLSSYIEPQSNDPDTEAKQPTAAHRAIASLIRDSYINVVITTNFDRLLEQALSAVNVEPVILSTPDQVEGAPPLSQAKCTIFKVHGDYLDPGIRNTEDELETYPEPFDTLLDRIIDEYGLIVCGWSGEWDPALCAAFERAKTRRFATYWTTRGESTAAASALADRREAQLIEIEDADSFFRSLSDRVSALDDHAQPHPATMDAAVALMKRYLSESRFRIQLRDLVDREVDDVVRRISPEHFPMDVDRVTVETVTNRLEAYEIATDPLIPLAMVGAAWAEPEHVDMWQDALKRLSARDEGNGITMLLKLQTYPGTLLMYALGLGAVHSDRLSFLAKIFSTPIVRRYSNRPRTRAAPLLAADFAAPSTGDQTLILGYEKNYVALSDWLHDRIAPYARHLTRDAERFTRLFDTVELLISLDFASNPSEAYQEFAPMGAFGHRSENRNAIISEINESLETDGDESPYIKSRLVGVTPDEYRGALAIIERNRQRRFHW